MEESKLKERLEKGFQTNAELIDFLENDPPETWIQMHPKLQGFKYLPIDKVEYLLRNIFKLNYKIEILEKKEMFNAASVSVRVHYREMEAPYNWLFHDGAGADEPKRIFEEKEVDGKKQKVKTNVLEEFAVSSSVPLAKTLAIKDACDHFGKLFGSDLNRAFAIDGKPADTSEKKLSRINELFEKLKPKILFEDQEHIERIIKTKSEMDYDKVLEELNALNNKTNKK